MSNQIQTQTRDFIIGYAWWVLALPASLASAGGGIATDGTMGAAQTFSGSNVTIPQSFGSTAGNNLFHSFAEFNIAAGQSVEFTGSDTLQNVISRVTGPDATSIDGMLKSSIANAAFYFINPNGVTFGANASVDVPGAFHVATADKIDFPSGGVYFADGSHASTLSSETPAAFGFLGTSAANNGLLDLNGAQLNIKTGQTMDMAAGEITVENGAAVIAPAGEIRLVAIRGAGSANLQRSAESKLTLPDMAPSTSNAGHITVDNSALNTSGNGGGRIALWGGDASFTGSTAFTDNNGSLNATSAKGIDMRSLSLQVDNSAITFDTSGAGNAGNVTAKITDSLNIVNGGFLGSSTLAQGNAGGVMVTAKTLTLNSLGFSSWPTGIFSQTYPGSSGQAGNLTVRAGTLDIRNGGQVSSLTMAQGDRGKVSIKANDFTIDSEGFSLWSTGIFSQTYQNSGQAGNLTIRAGILDILNGGEIVSATFAQGKAGNVLINADTLRVDSQGNSSSETGIFSLTDFGSGQAGNVIIRAGMLDILNGGQISSSTFAQGNAGSVRVAADTIKVDEQGFLPWSTGIFSDAHIGSVGQAGNLIVRADTLDILNGGIISSSTFSQGNRGSFSQGGNLTVRAGVLGIFNGGQIANSTFAEGNAGRLSIMADTLTIDGLGVLSKVTGIFSEAASDSGGQAGRITIRAGTLDIFNGGLVSSSTSAHGNAGSVKVNADNLTIDGLGFSSWGTGIISLAVAGGSQAGKVTVRAGALDILNGGAISSSTFARGNAGSVSVTADTLNINGKDFSSGATGILSTAEFGSSGHAGNATVHAGTMNILSGGQVSSSTFAQGNAGKVRVAANTLRIDGKDNASSATGILSQAYRRSSGQAGNVSVRAETLDILSGGEVTSSTFAQGKAGNVSVIADTLTINSLGFSPWATGVLSSANEGVGKAGKLNIQADILNIFYGGQIASSTFTSGDAGSIRVNAGILNIDSLGFSSWGTGIFSTSESGSSGQAGNLYIQAETLSLNNLARISSDTHAVGNAGKVKINAGTLAVLGGSDISSASKGTDSSGRTGDVIVTANDWLHLADGGRISIENQSSLSTADAALIEPGTLTITAPNIDMQNSEITSHANGNVAAGEINVNISHCLTMNLSRITTTANTGDGGNININGGELITLQNSGFETTVIGENSRGGDISTTADMLVMNTGLIQANANGGSGGNITLHLKALIPSGNTLILGGAPVNWQPFLSGLNVIQAASEKGVSGTLSVTAPQLNLSGILANLGGPQFDTNIISRDYCGLDSDSSLARTGAGGLKPKSGDQLF